MKRFFCPICNRIKRTQKFPSRITNQFTDSPDKRIGICNRHPQTHKISQYVQKVGA